MMDKWRKDELDHMTCGEVALQVFEAEQEHARASSARARAASELSDAKAALEKLEKRYADNVRHEDHCYITHKELARYLNDRLHKIREED